MNKIIKVGVIGVALLSLLSVIKTKVYASSLNCEEIQKEDVKYVDVSMWDINPEQYNEMIRKISAEKYYNDNVSKRANVDNNILLFGSTEGMALGGIQNGFIDADKYRTCNGVIQGLVNNKLNNGTICVEGNYLNGKTLFPDYEINQGWSSAYNESLINWKFPFLKEKNGYYSFNSDQYHVKRDYSNKKFILHKGSRNGFYPFNNCNDNTFENKNKNLYFTSKFEIPFYMNKDGKVFNSETSQLEDMVFKFSGDDDVWIFVDDNLVVDLGGVHIKQTGNINFAKNEVYYSTVYDKNNNSDYNNVVRKAFSSGKLNEGKHVLRVFYMERAGGESNLFVNFNLQSSGLRVNHIDKDTNKVLDSDLFTGAIDTRIKISEKEFENYRLYSKPDLEDIVLKEDIQEVNYYYESKHNLNVKYLDILDGHEIANEDNYKLYEKDDYETKAKDIKDYKLIKDTQNTKGKMNNKDIQVIYYYQYSNCLGSAKYIDKTTNELIEETDEIGLEGEKKEFDEKIIDGYQLVEKPISNEIFLSKEPQTINYYYKKKGKIIVNYIDKGTDKNLDKDIKEGLEGEKVLTEKKEFDHYSLFKSPDVEEYTISREEINVNYYYLYHNKVIVNYIDKETNEVLDKQESVVNEGVLFKSEEKEFENYKLVEMPENKNVLVSRNDETINYYYEKLKFNLKIEMNLVKAFVNQHSYNLRGKIGKIETEIKEANSKSHVKILYNVKITNTQERVGGGLVTCELPKGYIAMQGDNLNWLVENYNNSENENSSSDNKVSLKIDKLNPGESVEYELLLTKNSDDDICGIVKNKVKIVSNRIEETDLNDNEDSNELVIIPRTGVKVIKYMLIISTIVIGLIEIIVNVALLCQK